MSSERPEFRPIEIAPARRIWPYALLGAAFVGALLWIARHNVAAAESRPAILGNLAPKPEPKAMTTAAIEPAKPEPAKPEPAKPAEGPNVLGNAVAAAGKLAMVARAELDRELGRTHAAQKQVASYRKQVDDLQRQLGEARAQIAGMQKAQKPPPPSDQEQILQMLAPVLRPSSDGRP